MQKILSKVEEIINAQIPAALCIVIETRGSTPRKEGSKMIVYGDRKIFGSIGGGAVEKEVASRASEIIASGKPQKISFQLEEDLTMQCGGFMEVYIEPINLAQKLHIFGAGHIGKALSCFAKELDFWVTVIDPRDTIFQDPCFQHCKCINHDYFQAIEEIIFDLNTYIVIVTPKHAYDEEILLRVARKPHAYLGMLGSKRKVETATRRFLEEKLLTPEEINQIDMPIGIKFKVETPQEIAISILARLIDVRNTLIHNNGQE